MMVPTEPVIILQQGATTFGIQNQFFTRRNFLLSFSPSVDDPKLKYDTGQEKMFKTITYKLPQKARSVPSRRQIQGHCLLIYEISPNP